MYTAKFFRTKLGQASLASIGAMVIFVALSSQIEASSGIATIFTYNSVLIA